MANPLILGGAEGADSYVNDKHFTGYDRFRDRDFQHYHVADSAKKLSSILDGLDQISEGAENEAVEHIEKLDDVQHTEKLKKWYKDKTEKRDSHNVGDIELETFGCVGEDVSTVKQWTDHVLQKQGQDQQLVQDESNDLDD